MHFKRRWVVRVRNQQGQVVNSKLFVRKATARAYKRWMDKAAVGAHKWQAQVSPGTPPVWVLEIERVHR